MSYTYRIRPDDKAKARDEGRKTYFTGKPCAKGHVVERLVINGACTACAKARNEEYRSRPENRRKAVAVTGEWQRNNPLKRRYHGAKRKAHKLQATLPGHEQELLAVYENAEWGEHVDHIVPLIHPLVCGLHVPWNLQYLPASANCSKKNTFYSDSYQGELGYV